VKLLRQIPHCVTCGSMTPAILGVIMVTFGLAIVVLAVWADNRGRHH
jgi:hypothetical protein